MRLPDDGRVELRFTRGKTTLVERRYFRHRLFWKKWGTKVLASAPYTPKAGDHVQLQRRDREYVVTVDSRVVIWVRKHRWLGWRTR